MANLQSPIRFSPLQAKILRHLRSRRNLGAGIVDRVSILVLTLEGNGLLKASKKLGISKTTVVSWRNRWIAAQDGFDELEAGLEPGRKGYKKLESSILALLGDKARSGAPRTFTVEQDLLIVALACRNPRELSLPQDLWTNESLAAEAVRQGIVTSISTVQVWNVLKKNRAVAPQEQVLDAPEDRRP